MAAQADLIICSDTDLLVLQRLNGISMLSPAQAAVQAEATSKTSAVLRMQNSRPDPGPRPRPGAKLKT